MLIEVHDEINVFKYLHCDVRYYYESRSWPLCENNEKNWAQRLHSNNKLKHKVQCNNWQVFSADITQRTGPLQTVFTLLTYLDERLKTCLATRNGRNICTNKSYTFSLSPRRIPIEFINCLRLRFEIAIYCNIFQNYKVTIYVSILISSN